MSTNTYIALDKVTVGTATNTITFSSIAGTYTDLVIVIAGYQSIDDNVLMRFNSDTASNYSSTSIYGNGSAASSFRSTSATSMQLGGLFTSDSGNATYHIMNYSNSTTYKTVLARANAAGSGTQARVGLWRSTSAITSVTLLTGSGNFQSGSTFSLYGIKAQVTPGTAKATGGTITYDQSGNVIHTFTSSGTFTPSVALTDVDYLVVAGGGGAGYDTGGGGGAGGLRCTVDATGGSGSLESRLSLSATGYTVTVGAGGSGGTLGTPAGTNGSNSVFSTITSLGGGYGPGNASGSGNSGGSGGGGAATSGAVTAGGSGDSAQGYNGASGTVPEAAGGGGGAGEAGNTDGISYGGDGRSIAISGSYTFYAGGGGGGKLTTGSVGGDGGGGAGAASGGGTSGTVNTGGGGGGGGTAGASGTRTGGSGGSGIVIIRYSGL